MKCLIIDDDLTARLSLRKMCEALGDIEVVGECESAIEAISVLKKVDVDFILLDIHMPEVSGFDFMKNTNSLPQIIITTTDKNFALEAFEYDVIDYLIKPVELMRFSKAIDKIQVRSEPGQTDSSSNSIYVNINSRLIKLDLDDILIVEAKGDYVMIKTADKSHIVHTTMKSIHEKLPESKFIKVHRSYIINIDEIVDIEDNSILIRENIIPISRANKEALLKRLNTI